MKSVSITVLSIAFYLFLPALMFPNTADSRPAANLNTMTAFPTDSKFKAPFDREIDQDKTRGATVELQKQAARFSTKLPVTAAEAVELIELEPYVSLPANDLVYSEVQVETLEEPVLDILLDDQLEAFAGSFPRGMPGEVVGVYVPGVLALPVMQQPVGQAGYVSDKNKMITQFSMPMRYGSTGLLAHNYLSGKRFFELAVGLDVVIIHGDGHRELFRINQIQEYQALTPNSPYSQFIDLDDLSQTVLTSSELFNRVYTTADQVVFQTCIEAFGDPSWGRIFVIAEPIEG
jgi:hypothetical protein